MVLGSTAQISFLSVGQLGGRWSTSSPMLLAAIMLPGQVFHWRKREYQQIPISGRLQPALPGVGL